MDEMDLVLEALNRAAEEMGAEDIDRVINYLRKGHQAFEKGDKPKKGNGPSLMEALGASAPKPKTIGLARRI